MSKEMPGWLEKEYFKININESDSLYNGFKKCFEILSKPENQAKMPEVKALVEVLNKILWLRPVGDTKNKLIIEIENLCKEALKPFKKEGSDGQ